MNWSKPQPTDWSSQRWTESQPSAEAGRGPAPPHDARYEGDPMITVFVVRGYGLADHECNGLGLGFAVSRTVWVVAMRECGFHKSALVH
jgi:hypothetical protein